MTNTISVAVVDDHPLFREGVIRSLSETQSFEIVGQGACRADAERIAAELRPEILLIDLSMPGGGLQAVQSVLDRSPDVRIVVLTVSESAEDLTTALNCGAKGYVLKGIGSRALAEILITVAAGETYVTPSLSARLLAGISNAQEPAMALGIDSLSEREREVLDLVAAGLSNKEIGLRLKLQEKTVKHHMSRILAKLKAHNRTKAAMIYLNAQGDQAQGRAPILR